MATVVADTPPAPPQEQAPPNGSAGTPVDPKPDAPSAPAPARTCSKCGAPMSGEQDWCLQCGAGASGSIGTPSWRSAAAILGAAAVLVLGAAAAAYAALTKGPSKAHVLVTTVAQTTTPTTSIPTAPGATATTPVPGATGTTSTSTTTTLPLGSVKPPKIPLTAVVPKASEKTATTPSSGTGTGTTTGSSTEGEGGSAGGEGATPAPVLLDTNAASTYNPYAYPASQFGDPSLAIDGDPSTGWTAAVDPANAPKMAEGLLIDLKQKQKLATIQLITSTPGLTVQVYGANGHTAPASITDPAWVALSRSQLVSKKHVKIKLRDAGKTFTFVTLWISRAPASSTPQAPGHVTVNELELFPPT